MEASNIYLLKVILAMAFATQICRFLPFLIPEASLKHPYVMGISQALPSLILVILVANEVLPGKNEAIPISFVQIGCLVIVVAIHARWRNAFLSIATGTLLFIAIKNWHFVGGF